MMHLTEMKFAKVSQAGSISDESLLCFRQNSENHCIFI